MASVPQEKLNLVLERDSRIGLVDQIAGGLAHLINSGALMAGKRLPSVRQLARELAVISSTLVES